MVVTKMGPAAVFPSKLGATSHLARMCGWLTPEKFEHGANDELTELLKRRNIYAICTNTITSFGSEATTCRPEKLWSFRKRIPPLLLA